MISSNPILITDSQVPFTGLVRIFNGYKDSFEPIINLAFDNGVLTFRDGVEILDGTTILNPGLYCSQWIFGDLELATLEPVVCDLLIDVKGADSFQNLRNNGTNGITYQQDLCDCREELLQYIEFYNTLKLALDGYKELVEQLQITNTQLVESINQLEQQIDELKTAYEIQIDELEQQIDELKTAYEIQIDELEQEIIELKEFYEEQIREKDQIILDLTEIIEGENDQASEACIEAEIAKIINRGKQTLKSNEIVNLETKTPTIDYSRFINPTTPESRGMVRDDSVDTQSSIVDEITKQINDLNQRLKSLNVSENHPRESARVVNNKNKDVDKLRKALGRFKKR